MKALTMTQPWASLVAELLKYYETRSWRTFYRGPLLIHASRETEDWFINSEYGQRHNLRDLWPLNTDIPNGAIIALCDLTACIPTQPLPTGISQRELDFGNWSRGRHAWKFENIRKLPEPVPCRGYPSVWTPQGHIIQRVMELLAMDAAAPPITIKEPGQSNAQLKLIR